ncbi:MAG: hypothetical protein ABSF03_10115 [Streptosporangiaceae bacterium]
MTLPLLPGVDPADIAATPVPADRRRAGHRDGSARRRGAAGRPGAERARRRGAMSWLGRAAARLLPAERRDWAEALLAGP